MRKRIRILCIMSMMIILNLIFLKMNGYAETNEWDDEFSKAKQKMEALKDKEESGNEDQKENTGELTGTEDKTQVTGEEKKEEGEDDTQNEDVENGEDNEKDNEEDNEGNNEEDNGEEQPEPIVQYSLDCPKSDGKKGYYVKKPCVEIRHRSRRGITKYELNCGEKTLIKGSLENYGDEERIEQKDFREGKHKLKVWMEDEMGKVVEEYTCTYTFHIDTRAPEIQLNAPKGFSEWYDHAVDLKVEGEDEISGVDEIKCFVDGKLLGTKPESKATFLIDQKSMKGEGIKIKVVVTDHAGNQSEEERNLYLDYEMPQIMLRSPQNYTITARDVSLECFVSDENLLQQCSVMITKQDVKGKSSIEKKEMIIKRNCSELKLNYTKNGIYNLTISAKDYAGHLKQEKIQFIIDKDTPIIRNISLLNGKYLRFFCMDYRKNDIVKDFTSYRYEIQLDGKNYRLGKRIENEGWHTLLIRAEDAAGNRSMTKSRFFIDHTKPEIIFHGVNENQNSKEPLDIVICTKEQDFLEKITINGVRQPVAPECKEYNMKISDAGEYDICVIAKDKASNRFQKRIHFQIIEKSLFHNLKMENQNEESAGQKASKSTKPIKKNKIRSKKSHLQWWVIMISFLVMGLLSGYLFYSKKK